LKGYLMTVSVIEVAKCAHEAAYEAATNVAVSPMIVYGYGKSETVNDGVCGFASVEFPDARKKWFKELVAAGIVTRNDWGKGGYIWVGDFGQSYTRKREYARVYAEVMSRAGYTCRFNARID
jgi:hypothetical protein